MIIAGLILILIVAVFLIFRTNEPSEQKSNISNAEDCAKQKPAQVGGIYIWDPGSHTKEPCVYLPPSTTPLENQ